MADRKGLATSGKKRTDERKNRQSWRSSAFRPQMRTIMNGFLARITNEIARSSQLPCDIFGCHMTNLVASTRSVPLVLTHETFSAQHTILESADKVPVAWIAPCTCTACPSSLTVIVNVAIRGWWVICRTGLQSNRSIGVEMTGNSLDGWWNAAIRVYCRGTLATSPGGSLRVQALGRSILCLWHLTWHEMHLLAVAGRLCGIRRRCPLLMTGIHPVIHWRLCMRRMELVHLHRVSSLGCGVCMGRLCRSLFACGFGLLLLLDSWRNGLVKRRILQVHRRHERPGELLLRDKGMQLGLLRGPSLQWVDGQKATDKVNKSHPVVQFYQLSVITTHAS